MIAVSVATRWVLRATRTCKWWHSPGGASAQRISRGVDHTAARTLRISTLCVRTCRQNREMEIRASWGRFQVGVSKMFSVAVFLWVGISEVQSEGGGFNRGRGGGG